MRWNRRQVLGGLGLGVAAAAIGEPAAHAGPARGSNLDIRYYDTARTLVITLYAGDPRITAISATTTSDGAILPPTTLTGVGERRTVTLDGMSRPARLLIRCYDDRGAPLSECEGPVRPGVAWRPFSSSSPWNTPIPNQPPLDPDSADMVRELSYGGLFVNLPEWSVPVYEVDSRYTRALPVYANRHNSDGTPIAGPGFETEPTPVPIPPYAAGARPQQPWDTDNGDMHLCIVDRHRGLAWGMWYAKRGLPGMPAQAPPDAWSTGLGAITDLAGSGVRPPWDQAQRAGDVQAANGPRASGFPLLAGLIRPEEILAGRIEHALVFAYPRLRSEYFQSPASTSQVRQAQASHYRGIPTGGRIQLDPTIDLATLPLSRTGRIIARCLQEYGAYCGDYAGATVLYADASPAAMAQWRGVLSTDSTISAEVSGVFTEPFLAANFRVLQLTMRKGQNYQEYPDPGPYPPAP